MLSESYVRCLGDADQVLQSTGEDEGERFASFATMAKTSENGGESPGYRPSVLKAMVSVAPSSVVVMCAEPGMGVTELFVRASLELDGRGWYTKMYDYGGMSPQEVIREFDALLRRRPKALQKAAHCALFIDNCPIGDEADVDRLVNDVRRTVELGCSVYLSVLPECDMLVERLGEAVVYWSCDLCLPCPESPSAKDAHARLTYGIPALDRALSKLADTELACATSSPGYLEAYAAVVASAVRSQMVSVERQARIAALLLGTGTYGELVQIVPHFDWETWRTMSRDAPVFGVDVLHGTYACVASGTNDALSATLSLLSEVASKWPGVVEGVVSTLCKRKEYARAAVASLACSDGLSRCAMGLAWGAEFVNAGEVGVALDAVLAAREEGRIGLQGFFETASILTALGCLDEHAGLDMSSGIHASTRLGRYAELALACREVLRTGAFSKALEPRLDDPREARALATHGTVLWNLAQGRLEDAYAMAIDSGAYAGGPSLVASLAAEDLVLCSLLLGITPSATDLELFRRARAFFERAGLHMLVRAHDAIQPVAALLVGGEGEDGACALESYRAERTGDRLPYGGLLLSAAISDLRAGVRPRALVRLGLASRVFLAIDAKVWENSTRLLALAVRAGCGERVWRHEFAELNGASPSLDDVVRLCCLAAGREGNRAGRTDLGLKSGRCPAEVLWLVSVLLEGCGGFSERLRAILPEPWCEAIMQTTFRGPGPRRRSTASSKRAKAGRSLPSAAPQAFHGGDGVDAPVEVRLLGGFEVRVLGKRIDGGVLDRRRAKSLLAILAAVPGHRVRRYVLMDSIWPSYDYESSTKCLYSATSVLRSVIGKAAGESGRELVVSSKGEGTVGLNMAKVSCDVDALEQRARAVLDVVGDDHQIVSLCRDVEEIYRGDLFVPPNDGEGIASKRAAELRTLYADALLMGAAAAKRLRNGQVACRLARKAYEAECMREDTVRTLVDVLCEAGRQVEAERVYEGFVSRMIDMTRKPPSKQLREVVSGLMGGPTHESRRHPGSQKALVPGAKVVKSRSSDAGTQLRFNF